MKSTRQEFDYFDQLGVRIELLRDSGGTCGASIGARFADLQDAKKRLGLRLGAG